MPTFAARPVPMDSMPPPARALEAPASTPKAEGLRGVAVSDSSISLVDGVNGRLLYRGYDVPELADRSTFEETAWLLLHGDLPNKAQLRDHAKRLAAERKLPPPVVRFLKQLPAGTNPMDALRTAVSILGTLDPDANDGSPEARERVTTRLVARFATVAAVIGRAQSAQPPVNARRSGTHAANLLYMLKGESADEFASRAMDVSLILHADHEFNASTFTARVAASTLSDPYSAITAAIGSLKGPLHGGANLAVMRQLEAIGSVERVEAWVRDQLARKEKVMGFGHAVYKTMDPRAAVLKRLSEEAGRRYGEPKWYAISARLQDEVQRQKGLWPNVDFYSASLYRAMGIPPTLYPVLFAVSRISGWLAHYKEQVENNKLIRPMSHYTGPAFRQYVPVPKRR